MTCVTKDKLEDFWIELIKIKDFMKREEVHFFTHCTHLNGRRSIDDSWTVSGYPTDLPTVAPLAKNEEIKGIWFEIHPKKLPDKSPYGNRRLTFKAKHLMDYVSSQFTNDKAVHFAYAESQCHFIENIANVDVNEENTCIEDVTISNRDGEKRLTKGYKLGQERENTINDVSKEGPEQLVFSDNKKSKNYHGINSNGANYKFSREIPLEDRYKKYKREDFLKDIIKPSRFIEPLAFQITGPKRNPLLFLECCHFYGNSQYVRFVLIRPTDSSVGWCYDNLKPVDIENNPFFEYHEDSRQVFSSRLHGGWKRFFLDILVIGNIHLNNFRKFEFPNWDKVKKLRRAGRDPKIGFVRKKK